MKIFLLILAALAFTGCKLQTVNSFSGDGASAEETPDDIASQSPEFREVRGIMKSRCAKCHSGFMRMSEIQWINNLYVLPGDAPGSTLYRRLRGANVGGDENMPQTGSLSQEQLASFYTWIQGIRLSEDEENNRPATAADRTAAALSIISTSCRSCHTTARTANSPQYNGAAVPLFANFTDDNSFVTSGLIYPGNTDESWLFQALKTWGSLNKMPRNANALSESGKKILEDWINGIGQP